jgi:hypothetical protein
MLCDRSSRTDGENAPLVVIHPIHGGAPLRIATQEKKS